ncbi:MAG: hypothetical protein J7K75_05415 [Desulfuromonas sp.]|nr:hypothetical protein [Desulfuromonas sp.]
MDWSDILIDGEQLVWQGRPAPRCFTFRRWPRALFGGVVLALALWWQVAGSELAQQQAQWFWSVIPLPFVLLGLYLSIGQLLMARWEWERVFFAITDSRVLIHCGIPKRKVIEVPLSELSYLRVQPVGELLGHLYLEAGTRKLTLCCVEYPQKPFAVLQPHVEGSATTVS